MGEQGSGEKGREGRTRALPSHWLLINSTVYDGNVCSVPFYVSTVMEKTRNSCDHEYIREVCWNGCIYIEVWRLNSQLGHSMSHFTHHRSVHMLFTGNNPFKMEVNN